MYSLAYTRIFTIINTLLLLGFFVLPLIILGVLLIIFIQRSRRLNRELAAAQAQSATDPDTAELSLGTAIRTQRQRCGMTQEELAEQLSVSRQAVSKWENDSAAPGSANLLALAQLFGISVDELLQSSK